MYRYNERIIGVCSICGGNVSVPTLWWSTQAPQPTCSSCGAIAQNRGPIIPMQGGKHLDLKDYKITLNQPKVRPLTVDRTSVRPMHTRENKIRPMVVGR